jgi:mRNA-degrading endonuclease toxin of MazEF toxin-antitoxin module
MGGSRRSGRIKKEIGILLLGTDTQGRVFAEETRTVVLSRHGAGILSVNKLAPDEILTLRFVGGTTEVAVRLVGEMGEDLRGHIYGVAFVDPDVNFRQIEFPPPRPWPADSESILECSLCRRQEVIDQTEIEADVYALAQYILRFCPKCGTSTQWNRSKGGFAERPAAPAPLTQPNPSRRGDVPMPRDSPSLAASSRLERKTRPVVPPEITWRQALPSGATAVVARTANRRRDVRTRVSFTASIRQNGAEEIVECDNISKGGLSFRSRKSYAINSLIEAAVPYAPGSHAIFVPARIKHSTALLNGKLFRYGAAYEPKAPAAAQPMTFDE